MRGLRVPQRRGRPRTRPLRLAGDRGYSHGRIRRWLRGRRIEAVIPTRKDQRPAALDAAAYRRRNVIERCVRRLKGLRRIATRYEKLSVNFLAMVRLGFLWIYLRQGFSDAT